MHVLLPRWDLASTLCSTGAHLLPFFPWLWVGVWWATRCPPSRRPNIWPREDLPELEGAFKALAALIVRVGLLLAAHCDKYVEAQGARPPVRLADILRQSPCHKVGGAGGSRGLVDARL